MFVKQDLIWDRYIFCPCICLENFRCKTCLYISSNAFESSYVTSKWQRIWWNEFLFWCSRRASQTVWSWAAVRDKIAHWSHILLIAELWIPRTCISVSQSVFGTRTMFTRDSPTMDRFNRGLTEIWMRPTHYKGIRAESYREDSRP